MEREFRLGPEHRVALRGLLKDLAGEGVIAPAGHRRFTPPGRLPDALIVQVTGTDPDGDAIARPVEWDGDGPPPMVLMAAERRDSPALAPGERVLAKLRPIGGGKYEGRTLKRLTDAPGRVLGVFRATPQGGRIQPTDRRQKAEWQVARRRPEGAEDGEIVLGAPLPSRSYGLKSARVVERLGRMGDARSVSLVCIHTHDIPTSSPPRRWRRPKRPARSRSARARTCAPSRWSPSTARTRGTSTTPCSPRRMATATA